MYIDVGVSGFLFVIAHAERVGSHSLFFPRTALQARIYGETMSSGESGLNPIEKAIIEVARRLGYTVYESSALLRGADTRIAVKLDSESGISHNDCERYSKELARTIGQMGVIPNYSLEVSSPGLNRKIRGLAEFIRFVGSPVKVVYIVEGVKQVAKGKLERIEGEDIIVSDERGILRFPVSSVEKANLDY